MRERDRDEGRGKKIERKDEWKVMFWNVVGLRNKDVKFWKGLENWDVVVFFIRDMGGGERLGQ